MSHFHYVVWNADSTREISLLELELQAEVDKYASALSLLLAQREGRFPAELFHRLFEGVRFLPQLAEAERARYEEAHRYAARFCRRLEERFLRARRTRPRRCWPSCGASIASGASQSCATRRSGPEPRLALAGLISHALLERDPLAELAQVALLLP